MAMSSQTISSAGSMSVNERNKLSRILIVEDEGIVAYDLANTLQTMGYLVVAVVDSAEDAIESARELRPDLVLMDVRLTGAMDGIDAAERIRQTRDIPIIYLTAHSDRETTRRAKTTQPFGYLVKPFKPPELRCAIEIAIHKHETAAHLQRLNDELEHRVVEQTLQLEHVNKELESFSHSVAHDLRAPLRGIDGFSRALIEDHADHLGPEGMDQLRRVRGAAHRMTQLIDDLLRLSRIGESDVSLGTVDLSRLARIVAVELHRARPDRQLVLDIQDGVTVEGDAHLLRILLDHLIGNAWKFTAKVAQAKIEFGCVADADEQARGKRVCFVRDNGLGFDMRYADKLFCAFQRLHPSSEFEGTGVGLAIVQRIVHRHGGRVWANSAVGKGATFYFAL
jgi:signal transduction histidine kinase